MSTATAKLLFHINAPDQSVRDKIAARLGSDFSPATELTGDSNDTWYIARQPIHLEEFGTVVNYMRKLEQLFSAGGKVSITPGYLTKTQLVLGSSAAATNAIYIGSNAYASLVATCVNEVVTLLKQDSAPSVQSLERWFSA